MKTFSNKVLTKPEAEQALDTAVALVRRNLPLYTDHCQNHSSVHDIYPQCENNQWTCGFWPGEVWLSYERTGDEAFKNTALTLLDSFLYRIEHKIEVDHHDMGFLYSPSCVAAYKLTGSEKGRKAAILAADQLCTRFQEKGEFFQAWGALGAADNYRYIIDCLLNVPLLYWASETTGDAHYADLAHKHVTTCLANSIRPDGSTYHTFFMDPVTGGPVRGATCQGYKDDSCWARGQAWGVYGTAISYRYTRRPEYLDAFRRVLAYYLERLPEDLVPYWDMTFTSGTEEPRDSSSASIVACGLLGAVYNAGMIRLLLWQDRARWLPGPVRIVFPFVCCGVLLLVWPEITGNMGLTTLQLEHLRLPALALALLLAGKIAFSCVSFASGVSGGILMPILLAGSMAGALLAAPLRDAGLVAPEQTATLLVLGMAGLFSASVRTPLTGAALVMEMCGGFHLAPAVLLAAFAAAFTANALHSTPVYDSLKERILDQRRRRRAAASPTEERS